MPVRSGGPAPYAPPATVLHVIDSFRDRGLRVPFTLDVLMQAGVSEALAPRTLLSLKTLDLIDSEGKPTPALEGLKRVTASDYKKHLQEIVRGVYAEVFQFVDLTKDDAERITDAFRPYEPSGQRARMVTLFLGLCEAAGMIPEGKKPTISAGRQKAPATPRASAKVRAGGGERPAASRPGGFRKNLIADDDTIVPEAITGLIRSIPLEGWTSARRQQFIDTFGHVLDFTVPIIDASAMARQPDEEAE